MEEVSDINIEELVAPDSYDEDDQLEDSKSPQGSLFRFSIRNHNINDATNSHSKEERKGNENIEDEEKEASLSSGGRPISPVSSHHEDGSLEGENEPSRKFYKAWFDSFLAKHEFDLDYLEKSSVEELEKTWVKRQLITSELRWKEAEIDLNFIKLRHAICKQWLLSL